MSTLLFVFLIVGVSASNEHITEHLTDVDADNLQPQGPISHVQKRSSGNANPLSREVKSNTLAIFMN